MAVQLKDVKNAKKEVDKDTIIAQILEQKKKELEEQAKRQLEAIKANLLAQEEQKILLYARLPELEKKEQVILEQIEKLRKELVTLQDERRKIQEEIGLTKTKKTNKNGNNGTNGWGPYTAYNALGMPYSRSMNMQQWLYGLTIGAGGSAKDGRLTCSEFRERCAKEAGKAWGEFEKVQFEIPLTTGKTFYVHLRKEGN